MADDQNSTQTPIPEESSIPPSPQEPTEPVLENTAHSESSDAPPDALESSPLLIYYDQLYFYLLSPQLLKDAYTFLL